MYKANITPDDLVFMDLKGNKLEGKEQPTSETPFIWNYIILDRI
jgi:ribulose-5-phosphate 4-epimerase/fuculose-1-phosphate aldolase